MAPLPSTQPEEDLELGELEHDAFLPDPNATKQNSRLSTNFITRHLPLRIRIFLENLSRLKVRTHSPMQMEADIADISRDL